MDPDHLIVLEVEPKLRTKQELAEILQVSYSTLWRRLKEQDIALSRRLLNHQHQKEVAQIFGFRLVFDKINSQLK